MKKVCVLTSSRADFGIYIPLLKNLSEDENFDLEIVAFGTHMSKNHGYTVTEIKNYNFGNLVELETPLKNATPYDISVNIAETTRIFSDFWKNNKYDIVIALGDRYEMYAAVLAASPFNFRIAHIHGGETTLGAIDNMYRHSITLMSDIVFSSTDEYVNKANEIHPEAKIYNVGALSIDNLKNQDLYSIEEFKEKFDIDLSIPSILVTYHPETVSLNSNIKNIQTLLDVLSSLKDRYQIIITLPNADTMGDAIREEIFKSQKSNPEFKVVESFGMKGYLTCMKYCSFMLGNTSSGFVEASFFPTWVINIGNRQLGRIVTPNILNSEIDKTEILEKVNYIENNSVPTNTHIYGDGNTADKMMKKLIETI